MKITQVITTFNRAWLLRRTLERLTALTIPDEVLVIDDGGADETADVCREFTDRLPIERVYNHNPRATICSLARNIGVRRARNDWIVTSEPELIYLTDVIAQFAAIQPEYPDDVISAGRIFFAPADYDPLVGIEGVEYHGRSFQEAIGWVAPYTALWHRSWIEEVGGWDEGFPGKWGWDDTDLLTRLRLAGHGQRIDPEVAAIHQHHGLGGDAGSVNENYFRAKSFHEPDSDPRDVVANKEREWGVLLTPSS